MIVGDIVTTGLGQRAKVISVSRNGKEVKVRYIGGRFPGKIFTLLAVALTPEIEV